MSRQIFHHSQMHVLRRLPVPLPLVYEPVVDLLLIQPRRLRQRHLIHFLHLNMRHAYHHGPISDYLIVLQEAMFISRSMKSNKLGLMHIKHPSRSIVHANHVRNI